MVLDELFTLEFVKATMVLDEHLALEFVVVTVVLDELFVLEFAVAIVGFYQKMNTKFEGNYYHWWVHYYLH